MNIQISKSLATGLLSLMLFLIVTSVLFKPATALGTFTDFISATNFSVIGSASSSTLWAQTFNAGMQKDIGSFSGSGTSSLRNAACRAWFAGFCSVS
nr:hypothetical protein [Nitrosomonas sp. Nm84]